MKYLLYGYGLTNKAVAKELSKRGLDFAILVNKDEADEIDNYSVILTESVSDNQLFQYDYLIRSPGIPLRDSLLQKYKSNGGEILSEIELAYRFNPKGIIIAITGSNGKTTTLTYLQQLLQEDFKVYMLGNNDVPYISAIGEITSRSVVLLELSNFQLENIDTFKPTIAAITSLSPNHLDKVESLETYYESKFRLLSNMDDQSLFILNLDDELIVQRLQDYPYPDLSFSLSKPADYYFANGFIYEGEKVLCSTAGLLGKHNISNLLLCLAIARRLGVSVSRINQCVKKLKGPKYRLEYLRSIKGVAIYNDAKSTAPAATIKAIESFPNRELHILIGGEDKNLDFSCLAIYPHVHYYAYGQAREKIINQISCAWYGTTLSEAFSAALRNAQEKEIIVLSPSCASFDQFKNYCERGKYFEQLVFSVDDN